MNYLVGCIKSIIGENGNLLKSVDAENISPWVKVTFGAGGAEITVGNHSSPEFGHNAVIESFEYGNSDGQICNIEVSDQQGGEFNRFVDNLAKCIKTDDARMQVTWGWTTANCGNGPSTPKEPPTIIYVVPIKIDVSFSEGKIKFMFSCADLMQMVFVSRANKVYGTDENPMPLQDAIIQLFDDTQPKIKAKFLRLSTDGKSPPTPWNKFNVDAKGKWVVDNQNKLSCALRWLENFRTDRDRGIHPTWSPTEKNTIIFWEDASPDCGQGFGGEPIGTFIVNGGNSSNVISFNPKISWVPAIAKLAKGGGASPVIGATEEKTKDCKVQNTSSGDKDDDTAGLQRNMPATEPAISNYGNKEVLKQTNKSQNVNAKAASYHVEGLAAIEADLVIQGDPSAQFCDIQYMIYRTVGVVVINPFTLSGGANSEDWLAQPPCNNIMSNKNWLIKGVTHSIRIGSYTTTLKLTLLAPGIDIEPNKPIGDGGSYTPSGTC